MLRLRLSHALFAVLLFSTAATAQTVNLAWDASADTTVTGYVVKWGTRAGTYTGSINVGNRTTWTVNGLVPDQKYYFVVTSYSATGLSSVPSNEVSNDALIVQTGGVLADQRPSMFWYNTTSGVVESWHMVGLNVIDTRQVMLVATDTHWKPVGTGDLNGDGYPDLVWRHDTQGWLGYWLLVNNDVAETGYLTVNRMSDLNWQIKGIGDVNGDRYADLIWQNTNGAVGVWLMRGPVVVSTALFSTPNVGDPGWQIAAVADLNRDGREDLIMQHSNGMLGAWLLNGTTVLAANYLSVKQITDLNWRIQGAGDIDGSGTPRIIWRHQTQGWVGAWTMNGTTVTGTFYTNPNNVDNLTWQIVGTR
jgi:hypothetical protein